MLIRVEAEIWKEDYVRGQDFLALINNTNCTTTCIIASDSIQGIEFALSVRWEAAQGTMSMEPVPAGVTMTPQQELIYCRRLFTPTRAEILTQNGASNLPRR